MQQQQTTIGEFTKEEQMTQLVIFHIQDEEYGVPINEIQEIIKLDKITPIPDSPEFIKGIINVRGEIVTTIDMKERFFIKNKRKTPSRHIVITKQKNNTFGLVVDEVTEVLKVNKNEIKDKPSSMSQINQAYVKGVYVEAERLVLVLDLAKILSNEEFSRLAVLKTQLNDKDLDDSNNVSDNASENTLDNELDNIDNKDASNEENSDRG